MNLLRTLIIACAALLLVPGPTLVAEAAAASAKGKASKQKPTKKKAANTKKKAAKKKRAVARAIPDLTDDGLPNVQSRQGIVVDLETGDVLWSRQPDVVRPIASVSKLMAALVVAEKGLPLDETQTMSDEDARVARGGARSRLLSGYVVSNHDLLRAALLGSDNRAVSAMGRSLGMDARAFAAAMTERAKSLGLKKTRFGDPTGLDARNVSTPRELVELLSAVLANETIAPILKQAEWDLKYTVGKGKKARTGNLHYVNTNRLIKGSPYKVLGGKTGFTDPAKYCFVTACEVEKRKIAAVFLNGEGELTRFGDFKRVATWIKKEIEAGGLKPVQVAVAAAGPAAPEVSDEDVPQGGAPALAPEGSAATPPAPIEVAAAAAVAPEPAPRAPAAVVVPAAAEPARAPAGDRLPGYIPVAPFPPPSAAAVR
jgi:D-alanyl-D-alanine endopeptidase (penicillin-binding protein 7)